MSAVFNGFKENLLKGKWNFDPTQGGYLSLANGLGNTYFALVDNAEKSNIDFFGDNTYGNLSFAIIDLPPLKLFKDLKGDTGTAITASDLAIFKEAGTAAVGLETTSTFSLLYDVTYVSPKTVGGLILFEDVSGGAGAAAPGDEITPEATDLGLVFYSFASSFTLNGTEARKVPLENRFLLLDNC